jgi:hypothetical protein
VPAEADARRRGLFIGFAINPCANYGRKRYVIDSIVCRRGSSSNDGRHRADPIVVVLIVVVDVAVVHIDVPGVGRTKVATKNFTTPKDGELPDIPLELLALYQDRDEPLQIALSLIETQAFGRHTLHNLPGSIVRASVITSDPPARKSRAIIMMPTFAKPKLAFQRRQRG